MSVSVDSGYLLAAVACPSGLRDRIEISLNEQALTGTLIIAPEGINWSVSGKAEALAAFTQLIGSLALVLDGPVRSSRTPAIERPFDKLKIRVREELVTSGAQRESLPTHSGTHLPPRAFNALIDDPATRLIDVRNRYEIDIGTFPGAENPGTDSFTEFQDYVDQALVGTDKSTPLALCCTGGIRCERASQLLIDRGFREVYQLEGGLLAYLSEVPFDEQRFDGECFVFDARVSLTRRLAPGSFELQGGDIIPKAGGRAPPRRSPE